MGSIHLESEFQRESIRLPTTLESTSDIVSGEMLAQGELGQICCNTNPDKEAE